MPSFMPIKGDEPFLEFPPQIFLPKLLSWNYLFWNFSSRIPVLTFFFCNFPPLIPFESLMSCHLQIRKASDIVKAIVDSTIDFTISMVFHFFSASNPIISIQGPPDVIKFVKIYMPLTQIQKYLQCNCKVWQTSCLSPYCLKRSSTPCILPLRLLQVLHFFL